MLLPAFSFDQTVSPQTAKQDKLEIKLEEGALLADLEGTERFLRMLGAPPTNYRDNANIDPFGPYFTGQQGYEDRFSSQPIRSVAFIAGGQRFPPPLVSGHLEIFPAHSHADVWRLSILASLNPTRFLRHQRLPWLLRPFSQEPPPTLESNLFERSVGVSYDGEFALCRDEQHKGDNWIPNSPSWQYYASPTSWPTQLRHCLTVWPNTLLSELERAVQTAATASPEGTVQLMGRWKYNVRRVETYWEFTSLTPLGVVRSLEPMLRAFSNYVLKTTKYPCTVTHEELDNSWCLKLPTRTGETLKVYAKTNHRIRFEVVHNLIEGFRAPGGRHTFNSIQSAYPFVEALADIAARRVNQAMRHSRRNAFVPTRQRSALALLTEIQNACKTPSLASDLLDMLISNRSIVVKKGTAITLLFGNALRQLERRHVLQKSNGRYSVTTSYKRALDEMSGGGLGCALAARQQTRRR